MSAARDGCDERRDDLAAYSLGALALDEAGALERHVAGCDACRDHLRWLTPALDVLPASVEQLTPPDSLRDGLMATVRAESADAHHARILGIAKRAPLLVQERVTYAGDRVIELSTSAYRADRYRIHMAITPRGAREN